MFIETIYYVMCIYDLHLLCLGRSASSCACRIDASSTFTGRRKVTARYAELEDELVRRETQLNQ